MEEDGMDSLFEGMVLFPPSNQFPDEQPDQQQQPFLDDPPPKHPQKSASESDDTIVNRNDNIAVPEAEASSHLHQAQQLPEPLDENLFSSLETLTQSDPITTSPTSNTNTSAHPTTIISRQISSTSRKKKRAATVRIGYARDHSHPPPSPLVTSNRNNLNVDHHHHDDDDASQSPSSVVANPNDDDDADAGNSLSDSRFENKKDETLSQYDYIKAQTFDKLETARLLIVSVFAARKESISRRRKAAEDLNLASANHAQLEHQLEDACEAEDFETAQRISDSLAAAEKERQTLLLTLRDAEAHCDAIDSQMSHALDSQIAAEQECASLLLHFAKDAENNADLIVKNAQLFSSKEIDDWFSSSQVLEAKKIELDIESHFIKEARLQVNDSIQHSVEDDRNEREILCKKKDVLNDELHHLLDLVKQKEMELAENDTKIKAVDERIAAVVSDFKDIQSSVNAKFDDLQSHLSQIHLQSEALSTKRTEIDKFLSGEEDRGAKLRELARLSEDEAKAYQEVVELRKSLKLSILKSREEKLRLAKTEEKLTLDVQMLQQEVSAARGSLQELSSTKSSIQQNISSFKQRILFIDKRVPELEAEKKVAAAARNFKEAARIAAEAKSLSVEKDSLQIDLEKETLELEKLEEDIKDTVTRLQTTEGLILSKEKEVAMARFHRLLLIAGAATAERFAALELGDIEEANLLLAEAEAANDEAKKLQPIYNFKEEDFSIPKHFISMELVSNLGRKQLAELTASVHSQHQND
ncbi:unnamed protein product [Dovyalis caffra]|uniref:UVR domain-containing protein n=1 Tax=Dovyalis caffra TaxID=77055 RepID=A0AAV1S6B8_9ROSI|nr:unnamed protein product [Dovyalis caffra]